MCFSGDDLLRSLDHVRQQRLAGDLMQHFGAFGLETRAFARGHDHDGEVAGAGHFLA